MIGKGEIHVFHCFPMKTNPFFLQQLCQMLTDVVGIWQKCSLLATVQHSNVQTAHYICHLCNYCT